MDATNVEQHAPDLQRFASFQEFFPYYMTQHSNRQCRRLHFVGTALWLGSVGVAVATLTPTWLIAGIVSAYTLAWIGHFTFERNKPAAWTHFIWSFMSDHVMFVQMLRGEVTF
jgi:hypothetical protein